jgi:uncharacterized repeat protein (TIGR02543 family)
MRSVSALSLVLAFGACAFGQPSSNLAIKVSHSGNFLQGQTNAFYLIRVSNPGHSQSRGSVLVTDNAQSALKITLLSGEGWFCSSASCWRDDALPAGQAYPAIMALGTVGATAPSRFTYTATVTRDSNWNGTAEDVTAIDAHGYPIAWGYNYDGESSVPAGLTNGVAVAAGEEHSLALKSDGTVAAWGYNGLGETNVPAGLKNVVAIAAGYYHSLALKSDGTVVAWGYNYDGETNVPAGLTNGVAVAAGAQHSLALRSDGTVVAWGYNYDGETSVPAGLTSVVAIAAGGYHSLALKSGGTVVAWGSDWDGETNVPAGLTNVMAVAAGDYHSLALKSDGTVVAWGADWYGQTHLPAGLANVFAIAGGYGNRLVLASSASNLIATTITTTGCESFEVGGTTYYCGVLFDWTKGSSHTIATTTPQYQSWGLGGQTVQAATYTFTSWSDGGALSHTIQANTPGKTYTANFTAQYLLLTAVSPAGGGSISPPTGWHNPNAVVTVTAIPATGYTFTGWSGACAGTGACQVTMWNPQIVTANFAPAP